MRCCCIENRDRIILQKIIGYCKRIADNLARFENSRSIFESDTLLQNACCMCVIQIGELAGQLSEEAKRLSPAVPWRIIKDTRNFCVHAYGAVDIPSVWETLQNDIPALCVACEKMITEKE